MRKRVRSKTAILRGRQDFTKCPNCGLNTLEVQRSSKKRKQLSLDVCPDCRKLRRDNEVKNKKKDDSPPPGVQLDSTVMVDQK